MVKGQLRGKYVPDKDGKLRPVLKLIEMNANLPEAASCCPHSPMSSKPPAWYSRVWLWVKSKVF